MIRSPLTTSPPASPPRPQHTNLTFLWSEENSKYPIIFEVRDESQSGRGLRGSVCGDIVEISDLNITHLSIFNLFQLIVEVNNIGYDNILLSEENREWV